MQMGLGGTIPLGGGGGVRGAPGSDPTALPHSSRPPPDAQTPPRLSPPQTRGSAPPLPPPRPQPPPPPSRLQPFCTAIYCGWGALLHGGGGSRPHQHRGGVPAPVAEVGGGSGPHHPLLGTGPPPAPKRGKGGRGHAGWGGLAWRGTAWHGTRSAGRAGSGRRGAAGMRTWSWGFFWGGGQR